MEPSPCEIVVCDGGALQIPFPDGPRQQVRYLSRVVAPGGHVVIRVFVPPARAERPDEVLADLLAGRIANLNLLKLRLLIAMQPDAESGVELARVWDAVDRVAPDYQVFADRIG